MRVLITGAGGQLGTDLQLAFASDEVVALSRAELDLADRDQVLGAICSVSPDIVVNAGAWTAVDDCESDPDRAFAVNALGPRWVADAARRVDAHVVHISTDYVFDGEKVDPYVEWDTPNPRSVYGRSKLGGELELAGSGHTIVRTAWVVGEHGNNMLKTVLRLIESHPSLSFVDDQRGCPTFTDDLALMIRRLAAGRMPGVFHVTNQGAVSWYEFVREVLIAAGESPDRVQPIATHELDPPRPAPRPANSVLDNAALRLSGVELLPDFRERLGEVVERLRG
ncbi:MAG: dTDP-4-dehydrorhamnose reductase [Actinomycetia bacterium]|nr:dTDP-4-dehydrorhamnose reductase [Actinomycetes bacterium]